jgi:serine protease Do
MRRAKVWGSAATVLAAAAMMLGASSVRAGDEAKPAKPKVRAFRLGAGAHLGVSLEDVGKEDLGTLKLSEEKGAVVKEVYPDTPAAKAGLEPGDVILKFQGEPVWSAAQLARFIRETPAGRTVNLEVSRGGSQRTLQATLDKAGHDLHALTDLNIEMPELPEMPNLQVPMPDMHAFRGPKGNSFSWSFDDDGENGVRILRNFGLDGRGAKLGIRYQELTDQLAGYFKVEGGVLVSSVDQDGPAGKAGVKAGDVIVKVDGKTVKDSGDLREAVSGLEPGHESTLTVHRDGHPLDLKVTVAGRARRTPRAPTT